ncbi:MAG: hypothetical protein J6Z09_01505, partial [Lachnospiraceae bacterium]|nr:hypothetical protein [Lachnospiraceae bacterium]
MRKKAVIILIGFTFTACLFACGKEPAPEAAASAEITQQSSETPTQIPTDVPDETEEISATTLFSEEEIKDFIKGDWRFYDIGKNEEFASISFSADGSFKFERDF